ncbi:MAG: c-type cytochrome [Gemmatimonadota bacterium]
MRWIAFSAGVVLLLGTGCEAGEEAPPRTEADEVAAAAEEYDPAVYDTVDWPSDSAAIARGRDIYTWACAECHGEEGRGEGGRVIDGDTLRPPSFRQQDWPYADDPEQLHRKIYVGTELGMPHWGLRRMQPRDIVAVERFIRLELIQEEESPQG